jgi:UDP-3-O-[3-hydroxymyristoyl] glucosamine N-acyltransferase
VEVELKAAVSASWVCRRLGLQLIGPDRVIRRFCSLDALTEDGLAFVLPERGIQGVHGGTIIALSVLGGNGVSVIASSNPRLEFIRAQYMLREQPGFRQAWPPASIHGSVEIGRYAVIEAGVSIGEGTVIGPQAVIRSGTRIGRWCEIRSGAVIGDSGFGFERDEAMRPLKMLHFGGVIIGDRVEVGALTTIARGALGNTVLEDDVKINDQVHIAHNCRIGSATIIGACADLSGSLKVAKNCWIAPNCSIRQKLTIGEGATIGIGAVVVKSVEAGAVVAGNPASPLRRPA